MAFIVPNRKQAYAHTRRRFRERYGLDLTLTVYEDFNGQILTGQAKRLKRINQYSSEWKCFLPQGYPIKQCRVVFLHTVRYVVTSLPSRREKKAKRNKKPVTVD